MSLRHLVLPVAFAAVATLHAQTGDPAAAAVAQPTALPPATATPVPPPASAATRIIYAPRLPTAADLTAVAAAQHLVISKIEITPTQVNVTWQADGAASTTVVYRLLSSVDSGSPEVVYRPAPRVIYYDDYPGYYGYPYGYPYGYGYPSLSLGFNAGFGGHRGHGRGR